MRDFELDAELVKEFLEAVTVIVSCVAVTVSGDPVKLVESVAEEDCVPEVLNELDRDPAVSLTDSETVCVTVLVGGGVTVELPVKDTEKDWDGVAEGVWVGVQHLG